MDGLVVCSMVSGDTLAGALRRVLVQAGWIEVEGDAPETLEISIASRDRTRADVEAAAAWLPGCMSIETLARALADALATEVVVVGASFPAGRRGEDPSARRATARPGEAPSIRELDDDAEEIAQSWRSDGPIFEEGEAAYDLAAALADVPNDLPTRQRLRFARDARAKVAEILALVRAATSWAWTTSRGRPALRLEAPDGTKRLQVLTDAMAIDLRAVLEQPS